MINSEKPENNEKRYFGIVEKMRDTLNENLKNLDPKFSELVRDETGKITGIKVPKENFQNLTPRMRFIMNLHTIPHYKLPTMSETARDYAVKCHKETNHKYDGREYFVHLQMVVDVANQFIHLIPEYDRQVVLSACWNHDVLERLPEEYQVLKKKFGVLMADIVYAVSTEKGKTRKERANEKYYKGIRSNTFATFVKLCDRIANLKYSKETNNQEKISMYVSENPEFVDKLYRDEYVEMFDYLSNLAR